MPFQSIQLMVLCVQKGQDQWFVEMNNFEINEADWAKWAKGAEDNSLRYNS